MADQRSVTRSSQTTTVADILERVLDKGIVIAGDIKVNLVNIELLSIQIRLVICSIDKAKEIGMDWWEGNPAFTPRAQSLPSADSLARIEERLERLEASIVES